MITFPNNFVTIEHIRNYLIQDGYDPKLIKLLSNQELKRIFIVTLCLNSQFEL